MAGSWTSFQKVSPPAGTKSLITKYYATFTADSSDGSIPVTACSVNGAFLCGFGIEFGATGPDALSVTLTDENDLTIATASLSAEGRGTLTSPVPVLDEVNVVLTGNSTNSSTGTIYLYMLNNIQ